jgi:quercetin dioxygenase-like cupin family protein
VAERSREVADLSRAREFRSLDTQAGPRDWFIGAVYIDTVAARSASSRLSASNVHFTPGARTAWHTHPNGQHALGSAGFV